VRVVTVPIWIAPVYREHDKDAITEVGGGKERFQRACKDFLDAAAYVTIDATAMRGWSVIMRRSIETRDG